MKIKKNFQILFKTIFRYLFTLIYGKIFYDEKLQFKNKVIKIKNDLSKTENFNRFYYISDGRVYTDLVEHVSVIENNYIVPEISYQQINGELRGAKYNKTLLTGTPRILKKINGSVLTLVQGASGNNYFHFLFDIVAKLQICEKVMNLNDIDYFFLPGTLKYQKEILSVYNIKENQMIDSRKNRHIFSKKIYAITHPWYQKGYVQNEINNIPDWLILNLRKKFIKLKKKFSSNSKIFIDRSDSSYNHCKLINNSEIIKFLENKGFKSYKVSELDFFEQIYLFNNAKYIIGPHGAAFTNLIFSNPGLKLIEIIPKNHKSIKCKKFSNLLEFDYTRIPLDQIENNIHGDMYLDTNKLKTFLS